MSPAKPIISPEASPDEKSPVWSPTSATLIFGEWDPILVDPLLTVSEATALAEWVAATGKNLTTIYVTHGHGDHFFGMSVLLDRFPNARPLALPAVVERMRRQCAPALVSALWNARFPGQLSDRLVVADAQGHVMSLEGHELVVLDLGHTDTDETTCLHIPDLGLVVASEPRQSRCAVVVGTSYQGVRSSHG